MARDQLWNRRRSRRDARPHLPEGWQSPYIIVRVSKWVTSTSWATGGDPGTASSHGDASSRVLNGGSDTGLEVRSTASSSTSAQLYDPKSDSGYYDLNVNDDNTDVQVRAASYSDASSSSNSGTSGHTVSRSDATWTDPPAPY